MNYLNELNAGGQKNRSENHSEIISKRMKLFYSTEKGKKAIEANLKRKNQKKYDKIINEYGSLFNYNLIKHNEIQKKKIKSFNIRFKKLLIKSKSS